MNPNRHGQAQPADTIEMVERAIRRCGEEFYRAAQLPVDTRDQQADRALRMAEVAERQARWWGVLIRHVLSAGSGASWVFASAALTAQRHEEAEARLWRDNAAYLRGEPVIASTTATVRRVEFRSAS